MLFKEEIKSTNKIVLRKIGRKEIALKSYEKSIKVELKGTC
jgi:hypothetical protein